MPAKRPHRKSRYGCDRCRKRRVKCDENFPCCTNCSTREEECNYSRQPSHQAQPYSPPPSAAQELVEITDMALMHHWCTQTCRSFTPRGADLFRKHVGQEALRHEYLMEAVLALTLLHMATEMEDPMAARRLVSAGLQHQNKSFSGFRAALTGISPENCDAVFTCSVLTMVCGILSPLLPSSHDDQATSTIDSILRIVDFMKGISAIVRLSRQWIVKGPLSNIFEVFEPTPLSPTERWAPAERLHCFMDAAVSPSSRRRPTFERAIQGLERVVRRDHCAVVWVVKVDSDYVENLRGGDIVALMIFMHWGVLLYIMDDMWWKRYSGLRLVEELSVTLAGHGEDCEKITEWCRKQVGLC